MSLAEFETLPAGLHAEWVRGEVIVSPPGEIPHQAIGSRILVLLATSLPDLVVIQEGGMRAGASRRIPDVLALRHEEKTMWAEEPPVLVVEVLSPSTRSEDLFRKPEEYRAAGVEQYWIVDRVLRSLTVLTNTDGGWDVTLELHDSNSRGEVDVAGYGVVRLDLDKLL
ncbi:MAG: Uma2 family endonuclease [Nocardioides sp.]|nr:Uma2 family endonuclease [Nocardioides sp.]